MIVVLTPHLERMMVALRALEPRAEEDLSRRLGELVRLLVHEPERDRPGEVEVAVSSSRVMRSAGRFSRSDPLSQPLNVARPLSPSERRWARSRSLHFRAQWSAYSGRSSRESISFARFFGSGFAVKAWTSAGVGNVPIRSSMTRRRNS